MYKKVSFSFSRYGQKMLLLLLLFIPVIKLSAQDKDSLLRIAMNHSVDSVRIKAYLKLAELNRKDTLLLALYANKALQLSEKAHFAGGKVRSLCYIALAYQLKEDFPTAKTQYEKAISLAGKLNKINDAGLAYRNYAVLLKEGRDYDRALAYNDTALSIFRTAGDSLQLETLYGNIGRIYLEQNKFNEAITYFLTGMKAYERSRNNYGIAKAYNDIGSVYERMGDQNRALQNFIKMLEPARKSGKEEQLALAYQNIGSIYYAQQKDSLAAMYVQKAYELNKKLNRKNSLLISIFNLAGIQNRLMNYKQAARLFEECIVLARELNNDFLLACSFQNAGVVYSSLQQKGKARDYFDKALAMEEELNDAQYTMKLFDDVALFYRSTGNYQKAYDYKLISDQFRDSLTAVEKEIRIAEIQTQYETEKKERKIAELHTTTALQELIIQQQKSRQRNIILGLSSVVLLVVSGTILYIQRNRARQEKIQFSSILEAEQKERMRIARDLHDSIGQMLSVVKMQLSSLRLKTDAPEHTSIQEAQILLDKTIQEVRHVSHNLIPEELNFGIVNALEEMCSKVNVGTVVSIHIDEMLRAYPFSKQFELSLYRIVQEILNNMLKHAGAEKITITMERKNEAVWLDIRDDGNGFDPAAIKESKGLGWKNILARVSLLNGKMDIHSEKIKGTKIQIILPQ